MSKPTALPIVHQSTFEGAAQDLIRPIAEGDDNWDPFTAQLADLRETNPQLIEAANWLMGDSLSEESKKAALSVMLFTLKLLENQVAIDELELAYQDDLAETIRLGTETPKK